MTPKKRAHNRVNKLLPVANAVDLSSVFMTKMKADLHLPPDEVSEATMYLGTAKRVSCRVDQARRALEVLILFELVGAREKDHKARTFDISAEYRLDYAIKGEEVSFSEDEVSTFAEFNAVFNAWPYWREFVQNTTTRLGLPPVVLPLHKVNLQAAVEALPG